jgi:hypothetical protein
MRLDGPGPSAVGTPASTRQVKSSAAPQPTGPTGPTGRNYWPYGIVAAFVVCAGFLTTLIVFANSHRAELVSADYYEQEIRYQSRMEQAGRAQALSAPAGVRLDPAQHQIVISLPVEHARPQPSGLIHLYRPAAAGQDRRIDLDPDIRGEQRLDMAGLAPGLWRVRIQWKAGGADYYADQKLVIPR